MNHILNDDDITSVVKSIECELRNYHHYNMIKNELCMNLEEINHRMYGISGIKYEANRYSSTMTRDQKVTYYISKKEIIEDKIQNLDRKIAFVNNFMINMNDEEREFMQAALIERRYYETNETIGVRFGITRAGVRYKINKIIIQTFYKTVENDSNEGGMIEQIAEGSF